MSNTTKYENRIIHKTLSVSMREDDLLIVNKKLHEIVNFENKIWKSKAKEIEGKAKENGIDVLIKPQKNYVSKQEVIKRLIFKKWEETVGIEDLNIEVG